MDILRRALAPISDEAWKEIDTLARTVFNTFLSARKFVDVVGPKGWDYAAVPSGRLVIPENQTAEVKYGIRQVNPIIETRVVFSLNTWELDSIARGAEDIDLDPLEKAARAIAKFEDEAIYYGFEPVKIKGLKASSAIKKLKYPSEEEILPAFSQGVNLMKNAAVSGPYSLVLGHDKWQSLAKVAKGYPMKKQIEELIDGSIVVSPNIKEAFLVSERGGDFRLTLGNDLAIGYESHDHKEIQLYFTESFTFQIIDPSAVVVFE